MRKWITALLIAAGAALGLLAIPTCAGAQVVAQGPPATTSDARAWPFKVVFGDNQIDPRQVAWKESAGNSTTTLLAAGGVFTGTYEDTAGYAGVRVSIYVSAYNGLLRFDWSSDNGATIDQSITTTILAGTGATFQEPARSRYFRVVYTDQGPIMQAAMNLHSTLLSNVFPDLFNGLLAPIGGTGATAPWNTRALMAGGQNVNGSGAAVSKYMSQAYSDQGLTDGNYTVEIVRAFGGIVDGGAERIYGDGGGLKPGVMLSGGMVYAAPTALVDTQVGFPRITPYRAFHINFRDNAGNEIVSATTTPGTSDRGLVVRNIPSGTQDVNVATVADRTVSGTLVQNGLANESIAIPSSGAAVVAWQLTRTSGGGTPAYVFQATVDDVTFFNVDVAQLDGTIISSINGSGTPARGVFMIAGYRQVRVRENGDNTDGTVFTVQLTATPATRPANLPGQQTMANSPSVAIASNQSAIPITAAAMTDRTQKTQITDGTRDGTVKAASTLPLATDTALVVTTRDPVSVTMPTSAAPTSSYVGGATSETTLLAANAARKGFIVINQSAKLMLLKLGTGIGSASFTTAVPPGQSFSIGVSGPVVYTGAVTGIWFGLDGGGAVITEL